MLKNSIQNSFAVLDALYLLVVLLHVATNLMTLPQNEGAENPPTAVLCEGGRICAFDEFFDTLASPGRNLPGFVVYASSDGTVWEQLRRDTRPRVSVFVGAYRRTPQERCPYGFVLRGLRRIYICGMFRNV